MDKKVLEYINKQKSPQKETIESIREIFLKTLKGYSEKLGWGVIVISDGKFYIAAMKEGVHVGFSILGLYKEKIGLFEGAGKTMRHIKIPDLKSINKTKLKELIKLVDKKSKCVKC